MPPRPVLEARGVCVRYAEENVVEDVTFTVEAGEFVGLVGPNGGGKSTLLRAFLGLVPVHCGDALLFGEPPERFARWDRVGYVPQHGGDARMFPASAFEVALLGRIARRGLVRRFTAEDKARARDALRLVGMDTHADRRVGELSGGQRQRVYLAKALAGEPELLVLDEPTTGIDPAARQAFYSLLDRLNHVQGVTVVLVSHDTQSLALSAHRVLALHRGLVYDGPAAGIAQEGQAERIYGYALTHTHDDPREASP